MECVDSCPTESIKYLNSIEKCKKIIKNNKTIIASISSAWAGEFIGASESKIVEILKLLGFTYVSETSLGVQTVVEESMKKIAETDKNIIISSFCPVVNNLITKRYHKLVDNILNVDSPTIIHARELKQIYGGDAKVITIGPCVAAKVETKSLDHSIAASITFEELKEWALEEGISSELIAGHSSYAFEPIKSKDHNNCVLSGNFFRERDADKYIQDDYSIFHISGLEDIKNVFKDLKGEKLLGKNIFELFACRGGCLYGKAATSPKELISKICHLKRYSAMCVKNNKPPMLPMVPFTKQFVSENIHRQVSERAIIGVLESLSIEINHEHPNCGACGYDTCRHFARQVVKGYAVLSMCQRNEKNIAQNLFSNLLANMQSGVAVVDEQMNIVEANRLFATLLGSEATLAYDAHNKLTGFPISKIKHFTSLLNKLFANDTPFITRDIQIKERLLKVSVVLVSESRKALILIRNMFQTESQNKEIVDKTRSVINDNLQTVQQIAYLLGETASRTEAILNSIVESQNTDNEK